MLDLGVKTDPIEYRYSFEWLFRLLADEQVRWVQLGTFFELYQLPDEFFQAVADEARRFGVEIRSVFTAHRELGGFFLPGGHFEVVARRNFERLIRIGGLLGARCVGSNPGAVWRDQFGCKPEAIRRYLAHMKELMHLAREEGLQWLTIEPMSCLAEPPTLPEEILSFASELNSYHRQNCELTVPVGFCADVAHGYVDGSGRVVNNHLELLRVCCPYLVELHLKNTDALYQATFGFDEVSRRRGIVDIAEVRHLLGEAAPELPVCELVGYLEIPGPKLGRDYSDHLLESQLRESLRYLQQAWVGELSDRERGARSGEKEADRASQSSWDRATPTAADDKNQASAFVSGVRALTVQAGRTSEEKGAVPPPDEGAETPGRHFRKRYLSRSKPVWVAPSLMCADLCRLGEVIRELEAAGADMLHIDVADGHFVPNLLLGPDVVSQIRPKTELPIDVHLMVEAPELFVERFALAGANALAVHAESCRHLDRVLSEIRRLGLAAGIALNPATPLGVLEYVLERLDYVLLLAVNPGFAGQPLAAAALRKIADCRRFLAERGVDLPVMVDGNVSFDNIPRMVAAGADILVAGTSSWFFKEGTLEANVGRTAAAIEAGLPRSEFSHLRAGEIAEQSGGGCGSSPGFNRGESARQHTDTGGAGSRL